MTRLLMGMVLLFASASVAGAQEKVWKTDGKRWFRAEAVAQVEPKVVLKEGDLVIQYVGKNLVRTTYREEARPEAAAKAHECSWRAFYLGKNVERSHFCRVYGAEKPCPGMNASGECLATVK